MSGLAIMVWLGGMYPAYMHYREQYSWFPSTWNAFAWPIDFGSWVAEKVYDAEEGQNDD